MNQTQNKIIRKPKNAFLNFSTPDEIVGVKNYDEFYVDYEIHDVPTKVGDGEYDYVMTKVAIEHKKDIREFIQSQAGDVGVYAYIDRAARGLVDIEQNVAVSDEVVDMSNAPQSLMEAAALGKKAQENFAKLDPELKQGMSMPEFLATVKAEDIIKFYANKAASSKVEVKEEK